MSSRRPRREGKRDNRGRTARESHPAREATSAPAAEPAAERGRPDLDEFLARPYEPLDRVALAALILLGAALHLRSLWLGYLDQDLLTLERVVRASVADLARPGFLTYGLMPLARELYLWWWGKTVGIGALGFHLLSLAMAAGTAAMLYRLGERWVSATAGMVAAGMWIAFAPLGSMLASVERSSELAAATSYVAALLLCTRGRWLGAAAMTGLAVLCRESNWTLPLALLLADWVRKPGATLGDRARRLAPAVLAAGAGIILVLAGKISRPGSPGFAAPLELVSAWFPPGAWAGIGAVASKAPWWLLVVPVLASLVVSLRPSREQRGSSPAPMGLARLATGWMVLALLPLLMVPGPHRLEMFAIPALAACLALGAALMRAPRWTGRAALAVVALASLGAHAIATPDARLTRYARAVEESARTRPLIDALSPLCRSLTSVPRTFAASVPPDTTFRLALSSGACVACRDPRIAVRFLAEFKPEDAAGEFGVLRWDARASRFAHERADARVRARIGEGLLVFARPEAAAACFASALAAQPGNAELTYPLVISLAASKQMDEARARWEEARRTGRFPDARTLAMRLTGGFAAESPDSAEQVVMGLAASVVADPLAAAPHVALGRQLIEMHYARSAAIELVAGSGISKNSRDVYWLARAYDALGSRAEALEAYRAALAGGLDAETYTAARDRLAQLMREGTPLMFVEPPKRP